MAITRSMYQRGLPDLGSDSFDLTGKTGKWALFAGPASQQDQVKMQGSAKESRYHINVQQACNQSYILSDEGGEDTLVLDGTRVEGLSFVREGDDLLLRMKEKRSIRLQDKFAVDVSRRMEHIEVNGVRISGYEAISRMVSAMAATFCSGCNGIIGCRGYHWLERWWLKSTGCSRAIAAMGG